MFDKVHTLARYLPHTLSYMPALFNDGISQDLCKTCHKYLTIQCNAYNRCIPHKSQTTNHTAHATQSSTHCCLAATTRFLRSFQNSLEKRSGPGFFLPGVPGRRRLVLLRAAVSMAVLLVLLGQRLDDHRLQLVQGGVRRQVPVDEGRGGERAGGGEGQHPRPGTGAVWGGPSRRGGTRHPHRGVTSRQAASAPLSVWKTAELLPGT